MERGLKEDGNLKWIKIVTPTVSSKRNGNGGPQIVKHGGPFQMLKMHKQTQTQKQKQQLLQDNVAI
jgi:hypothetical protein